MRNIIGYQRTIQQGGKDYASRFEDEQVIPYFYWLARYGHTLLDKVKLEKGMQSKDCYCQTIRKKFMHTKMAKG